MALNPILGRTVRDQISGFEGVATARTEYLNGCTQVCITPRTLRKSGGPSRGVWFDEVQIEVCDEQARTPDGTDHNPTGGPERSHSGRD